MLRVKACLIRCSDDWKPHAGDTRSARQNPMAAECHCNMMCNGVTTLCCINYESGWIHHTTSRLCPALSRHAGKQACCASPLMLSGKCDKGGSPCPWCQPRG